MGEDGCLANLSEASAKPEAGGTVPCLLVVSHIEPASAVSFSSLYTTTSKLTTPSA